MFTDVGIFIIHHIVSAVSIVEPVHINLIKYRTFGPVRRLVARIYAVVKSLLRLIHVAFLRKINLFLPPLDKKTVSKTLCTQLNRSFVIIKQLAGFFFFHPDLLILCHKIYLISIVFSSAATNHYLLIDPRLHR
jgi:hypothetical protein